MKQFANSAHEESLRFRVLKCRLAGMTYLSLMTAVFIAVIYSYSFWPGSATAYAASNDGLPPGIAIPSWASGRHIHFFPAVSALLSDNISSNDKVHNALGRRCEPAYCPTPPLLYRGGGGVQHNPNLYLIFWGSNWQTQGAATRAQLLAFYGGLSGSAYQGILTQYYDELGYITSNPFIAGDYVDESQSAPSSVNDTTIRAEIAAAIQANGWKRTFNAQFIVFLAPGSTYAANFAEGACAYHSIDSSGSSYTFAPYVGDEPFYRRCAGYDPNKNVSNVTTMLASHEYAESATDPDVNTWLTSDGYEIGDICASGDDRLPDGAYAQGLWDNYQNACSLFDTTQFAKPTVDIVVAEPLSNGYCRYSTGLNQGESKIFAWNTTNANEWGCPRHMAVGDLNNDGKADIIAAEPLANGYCRYSSALNQDEGLNFSWAVTNASEWGCPEDLAVGDLTGNQKADIVAVEPLANGYCRYSTGINQGNGTTFAWSTTNLKEWGCPTYLGVGDLNGDGKADIVAVEPLSNGYCRYDVGINHGEGLTFSWYSTNLTEFGCPKAFGLGDLNGR